MSKTSTNERVRKNATEWVAKHPSAVDKMVAIAKDMKKEGHSIREISMSMPERSADFKDVSPTMVVEILKPYMDGVHFVKERATIILTEEQKTMFYEMGADPSEFIGELVEWYRTAVFLSEKTKEFNDEHSINKTRIRKG